MEEIWQLMTTESYIHNILDGMGQYLECWCRGSFVRVWCQAKHMILETLGVKWHHLGAISLLIHELMIKHLQKYIFVLSYFLLSAEAII